MRCKFLHFPRLRFFRPGNNRGFSLIELMVTIAIAATLAGIAYPSLLKTRAKYQTRAVASDIFSSFRLVQTTAVKRNTITCLKFNKAAGAYTAFLDNGASPGDCIQDADEPTTLFSKQVDPGTSLIANFSTSYNPQGRPSATGSVDVQNDRNADLRFRNTVSLSGRVALQVSQDGGGTWQ